MAAVDEEEGRCVTGADDKTCRVYDLASGTALHVLRLPAPPSSVVLRGNACLVAASDRAYVFDLVRPVTLSSFAVICTPW